MDARQLPRSLPSRMHSYYGFNIALIIALLRGRA